MSLRYAGTDNQDGLTHHAASLLPYIVRGADKLWLLHIRSSYLISAGRGHCSEHTARPTYAKCQAHICLRQFKAKMGAENEGGFSL